MEWLQATRQELNSLRSKLPNGEMKSIVLLFLIRKFQAKLSISISTIDPPVSAPNFELWDLSIRNVMLTFRLHAALGKNEYKANKRRIRVSLARLSATYINFVLKFSGNHSTTAQQYRGEAARLHLFLNTMALTVVEGKRRSRRNLHFLNILLYSEELIKSFENFRTAFYLLKKVLFQRKLYSENPETYLKYLVLAQIFQNFSAKNKVLDKCLNDSKFKPLPSMNTMSEFMRPLNNGNWLNSFELLQNLCTSKLISHSRTALHCKGLPKAKVRNIKKYLKRITRKGNPAKGISTAPNPTSTRRSESDRSPISELSSNEWDSAVHSETIDEIMANGSPQEVQKEPLSEDDGHGGSCEDGYSSVEYCGSSPVNPSVHDSGEEYIDYDSEMESPSINYAKPTPNKPIEVIDLDSDSNSESDNSEDVSEEEEDEDESNCVIPEERGAFSTSSHTGNVSRLSTSSTRSSYFPSDASTVSFSGLDDSEAETDEEV